MREKSRLSDIWEQLGQGAEMQQTSGDRNHTRPGRVDAAVLAHHASHVFGSRPAHWPTALMGFLPRLSPELTPMTKWNLPEASAYSLPQCLILF